jgi:GH25 family lysozyme M1 (1,4-beta-N-acetylmuramidase)
MSKADCNANEALKLRAEVEQLEAQAAAMREALEAVMWDELETGAKYCIWCAVTFGSDHLSDCQGNNALAADVGRVPLEASEAAAGNVAGEER